MLATLRPRKRAVVPVLLAALAASVAVAAPAAPASNAAIVIPFEKSLVGTVPEGPSEGPANYYIGTIPGGTIEMWVYDPRFEGRVQHFTATLKLTLGDRSSTAVLEGRFNFSTLRVVLNGSVTHGWLAGARVHEESRLVDDSPLTFAGAIRLMPGSAG